MGKNPGKPKITQSSSEPKRHVEGAPKKPENGQRARVRFLLAQDIFVRRVQNVDIQGAELTAKEISEAEANVDKEIQNEVAFAFAAAEAFLTAADVWAADE